MKNLLNLLILLFLSSCLTRIEKEGYNFDSSDYQIIKEDITSQNEVKTILGSPSLISFIANEPVWIYFSQKKEKLLFFKPKITDRKILTIQFDKRQKFVKNINLYDLTDQNNLNYISDKTEIENINQNIFSEIFSNIGKISAVN
jgi:outer membrane protein assembly factor BamE (lipoprotein component of BamABCDE complex)